MANNKMPLIAKVCIIVVAFLLLPTFVLAQEPVYGFRTGDREFTLSGSGASDKSFDDTVFSTAFSLGYFFTDNVEGALRQSISFNDFAGANWSGSTVLAVDYHLDLERFQPLVGVSAGYIFGDADTWSGGPEVGVKYFVNTTTFVSMLVQYQFSFEDSFDDGLFVYGLGLGVRF